jgi:mRNA interferase MazF
MSCVRRGDVVWLRSPRDARGREQRGSRYGVVLQASDLLALSTVIVAPTSTQALPASFRPDVTIAGSRTRVLVDQLTAVERTRVGRRKGELSWDEVAKVDEALALVLGLR